MRSKVSAQITECVRQHLLPDFVQVVHAILTPQDHHAAQPHPVQLKLGLQLIPQSNCLSMRCETIALLHRRRSGSLVRTRVLQDCSAHMTHARSWTYSIMQECLTIDLSRGKSVCIFGFPPDEHLAEPGIDLRDTNAPIVSDRSKTRFLAAAQTVVQMRRRTCS